MQLTEITTSNDEWTHFLELTIPKNMRSKPRRYEYLKRIFLLSDNLEKELGVYNSICLKVAGDRSDKFQEKLALTKVRVIEIKQLIDSILDEHPILKKDLVYLKISGHLTSSI